MVRLLLALPLALISALALFSFMAWMVDNGHQQPPEQTEALSFNMVMVEEDQVLQRRQRSVPEQPEPPQVPEQLAVLNQTQVDHVSPITPSMDLGLDTAIEGLAINAPQFGDFGVSQQALPLYRVEPRYPNRALKRKLEGFVIMSFTIDPTGKPIDIEVVDANPKRVFEREATRALRQWKYQPKVEGGKAIAQVGQTVRLEFKLAK